MKVKNFHENIEKSLERLGKHVEEEKTSYETEAPPEKEVVKRSIQALSRDLSQEEGGEKKEIGSGDESSVLPSYLQGDDKDEKAGQEVEELVSIVFEKGLEAALKSAGGKPPFIEDAFHDALVDKLLPELKKRGIVK